MKDDVQVWTRQLLNSVIGEENDKMRIDEQLHAFGSGRMRKSAGKRIIKVLGNEFNYPVNAMCLLIGATEPSQIEPALLLGMCGIKSTTGSP